MRPKTILLLAVAGTCGLVAMLGVQQVLSNNSSEGKGPLNGVLIATAEILPGQVMDEKNVEFKQIPVEFIPDGAVNKPEQIKERSLKVRVFPGDVITVAKLNGKGSRNASSDVPKGMRAVSIPIDPTMTGSGLIHQGDRVDVLVTHRSTASGRDLGIGKEVKTVLEFVEVFAIDGQRDPSASAPEKTPAQIKNVSLLVSSEQAKLLKLAGGVGDLHLTLRGGSDDQRIDEKELFDPRMAGVEVVVERDRSEVRNDEEEVITHAVSQSLPVDKPETNPKSKKWKIEIFRGSEREIEEVDLPEAEEIKSTPTAAADQQQNQQRGGQPWMGTIRKLFGG
ncbi:MAG: Flp pilus assembly protein CpaB [Planctomycetia bacterium]|nr:Flp pilus assembly protein CpaB [Planctomycetia bacterium]